MSILTCPFCRFDEMGDHAIDDFDFKQEVCDKHQKVLVKLYVQDKVNQLRAKPRQRPKR
jgi:hypothetical protein